MTIYLLGRPDRPYRLLRRVLTVQAKFLAAGHWRLYPRYRFLLLILCAEYGECPATTALKSPKSCSTSSSKLVSRILDITERARVVRYWVV